MMEKKTLPSQLNTEKIYNYTHFMVLPLKAVGCWDWYQHPTHEYQVLINHIYVGLVLFTLLNLTFTLLVNLYTEWTDIMASLDNIADGLPILASVYIVAYFASHKREMYELVDYMNNNFKYHSARGLTNMTMRQSYLKAKYFGYFYTACALFSITMYVTIPVVIHLWSKQPLQPWIYMDVTRSPFYEFAFSRQFLGQAFVGLAVGQLSVFFASNAILLCGQLDLLCCSLRNARYTALLMKGIHHAALVAAHADIVDDEQHNYIYSTSEMKDSDYHYDTKVDRRFLEKRTRFDIYSREYDGEMSSALRKCAQLCQVVDTYKIKLEAFVSPLLALRVIQVTLYLCTLLYAATLKFDMMSVEYLVAVALDIFVYCYFGNQIIIQSDRVSLSAYHSGWVCAGAAPRRLLLGALQGNLRARRLRAGRFLTMDLHTFIVIIKTSFSYYTLLVNVNENK